MSTAWHWRGLLIRSIAVTVAAFVVVAVITVYYTVERARQEVTAQSQVRLEQLLDTVESTLRVACFARNEALAQDVARGLLRNPEILRVTISENEQLLADLMRDGSPQLPPAQGQGLIRRIHSPFIEDEVVGRVQLLPNPQLIETRIHSELLERSQQLAWQLALIAGAMVVTLLLFIIQPISAMSRALHRMDPAAGERLAIPAGHQNSEIGALAKDINALAERLVNALTQEHQLRLQREIDEQKFHAIFDNAESGLFLVDRQGLVSSWNPAMARLLDLRPEQQLAGKLDLATLGWDEPDTVDRFYQGVFATGLPSTLDTPLRRHDCSCLWLNLMLSPVGGDLLQGVAHDVSELKEAAARARLQAVTDPLTGLANRSGLEQKMRLSISSEARPKRFTLLLINLDKFRGIIEGLGVGPGDSILQGVAARLSANVKRSDTLARITADIFAIVLEHPGSDEQLERIIERLLHALRQPYPIQDTLLPVTASIGITRYPDDGQDVPDLLRQAELAVDKAKSAGGNQVAFYDPRLAELAEQRQRLEIELRHALRDQQFVLFYQAIGHIAEQRVSGAEALIRWQHPTRGLVPPDLFIPVLEQSGLIQDVGLWVLETACQQLASWQAAQLDLHLSLNVSGRQIPHGLAPAQVASTLARHGVEAHRLALEITEGVLLGNVAEAREWLEAIRRLGVRVYLDDFGTGYSSLSYLKRFKLDTLKIDRSFIQDMHAGNSEHALVEAIIAMAHSLDLKVVAEGVETAEQLAMLRTLGCQYAQGYYLARPLPIATFMPEIATINQRLAETTQTSPAGPA